MSFVAILMGSNSDWPVMQSATEVLGALDVQFEVRVTSAHRTPAATMEYVQNATERGCAVFICAAGMAAHLAGAVAAHTTRPVIGVPVDSGPLSGFDALLSTVQMPGGIPVATVAVGKAGAKNAGYLAAQILGLGDEALAERVSRDRAENARKVQSQNEQLQEELGR
ncbi:MAG: 5-(carboxyamino)imidazole ribonucleotide mutase [Pseudomonadales bacterium]|nr:5-(carboxyamino)imidazole ribonucleotide mutase [Pseudomonadales bacterium]NIX08698.1 5-(carboxyamino)imidazole ribonucleotide mutase [Pseudomonadales bacterium]